MLLPPTFSFPTSQKLEIPAECRVQQGWKKVTYDVFLINLNKPKITLCARVAVWDLGV